MNQSLREESEKLARSWSQHEAAGLRDYLVSGVEDPRINVQSVLARQFIIEALLRNTSSEHLRGLVAEEQRFAAAMNWLLRFAAKAGHPDEFESVLYTLKRGADNAEGIQIPDWILDSFQRLPVRCGPQLVPNYIEAVLKEPVFASRGHARPSPEHVSTFQKLWAEALAGQPFRPVSALEAACGSANDFRFLDSYGVGKYLDYTGFDLCAKNIENARQLFPAIRFVVGNVFDIEAEAGSYEISFAHDLFEHLSLEGLQRAIGELCRVTRSGICASFFNMDEIPEHAVRAVREYHWNRLSMKRVRSEFERHGFEAQVLHIGTFLLMQFGCDETHNPNAYTFVLRRRFS